MAVGPIVAVGHYILRCREGVNGETLLLTEGRRATTHSPWPCDWQTPRVVSLTLRGAVHLLGKHHGALSETAVLLTSQRNRSAAMSTTAIVILVAIGLVIMMQLNGRAHDQDESSRPDKSSSLAGYITAIGVVLGITVLLIRACHGSF